MTSRLRYCPPCGRCRCAASALNAPARRTSFSKPGRRKGTSNQRLKVEGPRRSVNCQIDRCQIDRRGYLGFRRSPCPYDLFIYDSCMCRECRLARYLNAMVLIYKANNWNTWALADAEYFIDHQCNIHIKFLISILQRLKSYLTHKGTFAFNYLFCPGFQFAVL